MYLTIRALEELYKAVRKKYLIQIFTELNEEEIFEKKVFLSKYKGEEIFEKIKKEAIETGKGVSERKIWGIKDQDGNCLFNQFITRNSKVKDLLLYNTQKYIGTKYKPYRIVSGIKVLVEVEAKINKQKDFISFDNNALSVFLVYLGFNMYDLKKGFYTFISEYLNEEEQKFQKQIKQKDSDESKADEINLKDKRNIGFKEFASAFENSEWWYYIRAYNRYGEFSEDENNWPLAKLILRFGPIKGNKLIVDLENTNSEHDYNFRGELEFQFSQSSIIVLNLTTRPSYYRFLNIVLRVGKTGSKILMGQFINIESGDYHVVSGSVILERIDTNKFSIIESERILIPKQDIYTEDIGGISKYILQFLSDKSQNFRRTPNIEHSLMGLKQWFKKRGITLESNSPPT